VPKEPTNIRRSMFRNGFRGYDANQVDDFLDTVLDEFRRTRNETQRMREEADRLRERLQQFEDLEGSIRAALLLAEQAANDLRRSANREAEFTRQSARREAEDVRQSARREAELTLKDAQARSHQILADSEPLIKRVQDSYEALQDAERSFANDFRHLLKTYTEMMESMEVSSAREIEAAPREAAAQEESSDDATDEANFYDGQTVSGHGIVESAEEADPADEAVVGDPGATRRIEAEPAGAFQATGVPRSMASPGPEADPQEQEHRSGRVVPNLAEGIELVGEYKGSGSSEAQYLVRRADGQFVHLSRLLYLVAEAVDGRRDLGQIAERVSQEFGRGVTADNVRFLAQERLAPLGVVATATEGFEPPRYKDAVLGLNYRLGVVPARVVRAIAAPFLPLFWPPVVAAVLCGLVALDVWIVFVHGAGEGLLDIIYQPSLLYLFLGLELVALVWHECGHATACRYGGARPGRVGVGLYIIWFVLFCDVTDSYRLDKVGRLRTDCGGLYFDAIFTLAIGGAYFLTGFEPLLALALLNQLAALDELSPFVRFDGYYIVSDLTGVPNLYQYIPPVIKGLIPGREAGESVKALKPWVRATITVWVLATVPVLLGGLVMLFYLGPWALAAAWDSFLIQYGEVLGALEGGSIIAGAKGAINILALLGPVVGGILIAAVVSRRLIVGAWRLSREGARRLSPTWAPGTGGAGGPTAEHRGEGATPTQRWSAPRSRYAVYVAGALVAAVGLGIGAFFVIGGQPEENRAGGGPTGSETPEDAVTEPDDDAGSTNPEEPAKGVPFVHVATDENSRGNYTYVGGSAIDDDPNAVVLVVAVSAGREGADSATYGHNVGVYYDPGAQKWAIFNQDRSAVPAGTTFRVLVPPTSERLLHRAELADTVGNATYLDDPLTNGRPGAVLSVTQNWNPGGGAGVFNDHPVGVFYDEDVDKWAIYNRDGAPMPAGAAFNVAVSGSDEGAS